MCLSDNLLVRNTTEAPKQVERPANKERVRGIQWKVLSITIVPTDDAVESMEEINERLLLREVEIRFVGKRGLEQVKEAKESKQGRISRATWSPRTSTRPSRD
jgi:hypothetical protein